MKMLRFQKVLSFTKTWNVKILNVGMLECWNFGMLVCEWKIFGLCMVIPIYTIRSRFDESKLNTNVHVIINVLKTHSNIPTTVWFYLYLVVCMFQIYF